MTARTHSRRQRVAVIGVCALVALVVALATVSHISLLPPQIGPRQLDVAAASARVSIDLKRPLLGDALATSSDYQTLNKRSTLLANIASSDAVVARIARRAGLDASRIGAVTRVATDVPIALTEPDSERRASQIAAAGKPYQLELQPSRTLPTIDMYAQAPSVAEAERLADAVAPALEEYLAALARRDGIDPAKQVLLEQLGTARGAIVNGGTRAELAGLTFLFAFAALLALALAVARARRVRGVQAADRPATPLLVAARAAPGARAGRGGDWPGTTRVLPWMVAGLIAMVFLVPFNDIQLGASLPIDLKLDRLVLPFLVATWVLVLVAGGPNAPKLRMTWIHVALGAVVAVACLSLVLNAGALNGSLEFDTAVKKLTLLASYATLFVVVASTVRRSEVHAFTSYTLGLALVCAVGTIVELRFGLNLFYSLSDAALPGIFQVGTVDPTGIDGIGRRAVRGPGQVPLELVAMLAMALPIALVRLMDAGRRRERVLYALAAGLLLAAMVATSRKTAFLAPISVALTLACFRPRQLVKLAPLGVALVLLIQGLSPGALSAVAVQLEGNRLGVPTVSDRTADYDAIRPDVWSHLAFGRGYGSYEHTSYRILDMELLGQLVEVGIVGLLAYLSLALAVLAVARGPIRERRSDAAPVALAVAPAAVCFVVISTLFDVMSFPHAPYIFLWMAALLAVMCGRPPSRVRPLELAPRAAAVPPVSAPHRPREPAWTS